MAVVFPWERPEELDLSISGRVHLRIANPNHQPMDAEVLTVTTSARRLWQLVHRPIGRALAELDGGPADPSMPCSHRCSSRNPPFTDRPHETIRLQPTNRHRTP